VDGVSGNSLNLEEEQGLGVFANKFIRTVCVIEKK